jgi:hypothetical protein
MTIRAADLEPDTQDQAQAIRDRDGDWREIVALVRREVGLGKPVMGVYAALGSLTAKASRTIKAYTDLDTAVGDVMDEFPTMKAAHWGIILPWARANLDADARRDREAVKAEAVRLIGVCVDSEPDYAGLPIPVDVLRARRKSGALLPTAAEQFAAGIRSAALGLERAVRAVNAGYAPPPAALPLLDAATEAVTVLAEATEAGD